MVSNYDRIFREIEEIAGRLAPEHGVDKNALVQLVMEIVNLEDRHRTKDLRINQLVEERIMACSAAQAPEGS